MAARPRFDQKVSVLFLECKHSKNSVHHVLLILSLSESEAHASKGPLIHPTFMQSSNTFRMHEKRSAFWPKMVTQQ